jgi:ribosome biogenesis protein BMS1
LLLLQIHIPGCGDFSMKEVSPIPDPCPFPEKKPKRTLNEKQRLIYAPMSDIGELLFDKDAVYINIPDHKISFTEMEGNKTTNDFIFLFFSSLNSFRWFC